MSSGEFSGYHPDNSPVVILSEAKDLYMNNSTDYAYKRRKVGSVRKDSGCA